MSFCLNTNHLNFFSKNTENDTQNGFLATLCFFHLAFGYHSQIRDAILIPSGIQVVGSFSHFSNLTLTECWS